MIFYPDINTDLIRSQFSREETLNRGNIKIPNCVFIIGLGGIGCHVAEVFGSMSGVKQMFLFDDDKIELSNLNRTTYRYDHIDSYKALASAEIISSRNSNVEIYPINAKFEEQVIDGMLEDDDLVNIFGRSTYETIAVVDCRDDDYDDYHLMQKLSEKFNFQSYKFYRAAYNGMSLTLDMNPGENRVWGNPGYQVIPSHSLPSRMVANMIVSCICFRHKFSGTRYMSVPLTFDLHQFIPALYNHTALLKLNNLDPEKVKEIEDILNSVHEDKYQRKVFENESTIKTVTVNGE